MNAKKLTFRQCLKELLKYVKPYRLKLGIALGMVVVSNITYTLNPLMEGKILSLIHI